MRRAIGVWIGIVGWCLRAWTADNATTADLLLSATRTRAGETVWAGIRLRMAPDWHTYWRNPGESGMATAVEWTLPEGITAGTLEWPPPETYVSAGLTTYVYHHDVVLLVPLTLAAGLAPGKQELKADVSWLECKESCVPGSDSVSATLEIGDTTVPSPEAGLLETWRKRIPQPNPALELTSRWEPPPSALTDTATLRLDGKAVDGFRPADFYPYEAEAYEVRPGAESVEVPAGIFALRKTLKRLGPTFPAEVPGLLVQAAREAGPPRAYEVRLMLPGRGAPVASEPAPEVRRGFGALLGMLGLAFLGGLVLNVMPCVLPVIALKILGFVQQSNQEPGRVRQLGLIYAAGVLMSFLGLAAMVLAVQASGGSASWGMQMQNPHFRLGLTLIVTLVALNLFGLFEITLGGRALGAAAGLASREGASGAFFNGVLAVALATPCTAPFLTVALGFAFTQSAPVIVLMFAATALGLAAPYVLLSWRPGWLKFLPKPGTWMLRFKVAMGFPMLATSVWLFDLTAPSFGESGALWLGLVLVLIALAAWVWGEFIQRSATGKTLPAWITLGLLLGACVYLLETQVRWRSPGRAATATAPSDALDWQPWSPEAIAAARAQGRPVLVDFTARWCLTCQSNKRLAIEVPEVRARLKALNTVTLRADNTDPNPSIAAELKRFERPGVPLVLVYPKDPSRPPKVLPTLLTPGLVLEALKGE